MNKLVKVYRTLFPRNINKLLQICLDEFDSYFKTGLCRLSHSLYLNNKISNKECSIIEKYLKDNSFEDKTLFEYWWNCSHKQPRIQWLKKQIELTSKK